MATERQIAANRANASKSTGPRSRAGRKRAAGNATVHGLAANLVSNSALAEQVEKLAREIAGSVEDAILLQYARDAAYAEIDLAPGAADQGRAHRAGVSDWTLDRPVYENVRGVRKILDMIGRGELPRRIDPLATMPSGELERSAEAVRRALPELIKIVTNPELPRAATKHSGKSLQVDRRKIGT